MIEQCCLQDMQRPLYMTPEEAILYGVADAIVQPQKTIISDNKKTAQYDANPVIVGRPSQK